MMSHHNKLFYIAGSLVVLTLISQLPPTCFNTNDSSITVDIARKPTVDQSFTIGQIYWGEIPNVAYSYDDNETLTIFITYTGTETFISAFGMIDLGGVGHDLSDGNVFVTSSSQTLPRLIPTILRFYNIQLDNDNPPMREIPISIYYDLGEGLDSWDSSLRLTLSDEHRPEINLEVNSTTLEVGAQGLELTVNNSGFLDASQVQVSVLSLQPQINILSNSFNQLGALEANKTQNITLTVAVEPGFTSGSFTVLLSYSSQLLKSYNHTQQFGFVLLSKPNVIISQFGFNPDVLYPGDRSVSLTLYLTNAGTLPVSDVNTTLLMPEGFSETYIGSGEASPGHMPVGAPQIFHFLFDIDTTIVPGLYQLILQVVGEDYNTSREMKVEILTKTNFTVESVTYGHIQPGSRGVQAVLVAKNNGPKAENVRLELVNSFLSGSTIAYTVTAYPSQSVQAIFNLDFSSKTPIGNLTVEVVFRWSQETGVTFTDSLFFSIEVREEEALLGLIMLNDLILGVVGLGVVVIGLSPFISRGIQWYRRR